MRCIAAAAGGKKALAGKLDAIPSAEDLHQLVPMRSENAWRNIPFRPWRRGVFVVRPRRAQRRANAMAAEHDHELQIGWRGPGLTVSRLRPPWAGKRQNTKTAHAEWPRGEGSRG